MQHEVQYRERSTHFRGNFRILQVPLTDLPNGPMGVRAILEFPAGTGPALPQGVQPHHRHILAPIRSGPGAQEAADNDGRSLQAAASIGTPMELTATFETGEESGPFPDPVTGGEQPPEALIESRRRAAVADARAAAAANAAAVAHAAAAAAVAEARLHPSPAGLGVLTPSRNTCKTRLVTSFDEESIDEATARLKYGRQPSTASGSDTLAALD